MKTTKQLRVFYNSTLRPKLDLLEEQRQQTASNNLIAAGVLALGGLLIGVLMASAGGLIFMIFPVVAGVIIGAVVFKFSTAGYRREFKNTIVRSVIEFLEPGLSYEPERGVTKDIFRDTNLFKQHIDRYRSEDLVRGHIGQTEIIFSEVHAEYQTTSGTGKDCQTHWHTIFKGIFFIGDFHKDFRGRFVILPDTAQKIFGNFGQTLQGMNFSRESLIKLDDPEFEREFVVYGDDQIEARYILSPSMMERITAFRNKRGTDIFLAFTGSRVIVAISTDDDLFEPHLWRRPDFETIALYAAQLRLATDIVEDLNLNTRIWSKI